MISENPKIGKLLILTLTTSIFQRFPLVVNKFDSKSTWFEKAALWGIYQQKKREGDLFLIVLNILERF